MISNIDTLRDFLSQPRKISITTHQRPDGDAMGSSLGLYHYLINKGHDVRVIVPTEFPAYFNWMPASAEVLVYPEKKAESDEWLQTSDLICCLDFNTLSRIAPVDEVVKAAAKPILLIDHHLMPDVFEWMLHDITACSTCELVFRFIHLMEENPVITEDMAFCIYTGILTDTGNFQNGATNKAAFEISARLMESGLKVQLVQEQLNQSGTESKLRFIGNALLNKMIIRTDIGLGIIVVDRKDARTYNLQAGDTEGLVNYPLSIREIEVAVLIKEEKDITKLSFRSKGTWDVNQFAREHFEGGGHRNAAGGKSILRSELIIKKVTELFEKEQKKRKQS
jgi:phosphoesterase RecJ-like protein